MALLYVDVTAKDIERGIRGDSRWCPVTLAIRRALNLRTGDDGFVAVRAAEIRIGMQCLPTPATVAEFLGHFDRNALGSIHPFTFDLEFSDDADHLRDVAPVHPRTHG